MGEHQNKIEKKGKWVPLSNTKIIISAHIKCQLNNINEIVPSLQNMFSEKCIPATVPKDIPPSFLFYCKQMLTFCGL